MKSATTYSASPRFLSLKRERKRKEKKGGGYSTRKVGKNKTSPIIMYSDKNLSTERNVSRSDASLLIC